MFENVREDLRRAMSGNQHAFGVGPLLRELLFHTGTQAVLVYRLGAWIHTIPYWIIRAPLKFFYAFLRYWVCLRVGIYISPLAQIGPGFLIHGLMGGIGVGNTKVGRNFTIVGGQVHMDFEIAEIGDDVMLGIGTKLVGRITIGDRARTGPNSVVQADVPADCVAFGNPARIIGPIPRITYEQGAKRIVPKTVRPKKAGEAGAEADGADDAKASAEPASTAEPSGS